MSWVSKEAKELALKTEGGLWWPKDERADKTKEGLGMQEQKNQTLIILPSRMEQYILYTIYCAHYIYTLY